MKVAALPRLRAQVAAVLAFVISHTTFLAAQDDETGRCPKMACKSPVTSHSRLFIPTFKLQTSNFKLHGSGVVCSIPTLKRKSIAIKKTLLKESFLLLVIGCSGGSLSVLWETSNLRGASDFYAPHHHFSFLISHSRETFIPNQRASCPTELTLPPFTPARGSGFQSRWLRRQGFSQR